MLIARWRPLLAALSAPALLAPAFFGIQWLRPSIRRPNGPRQVAVVDGFGVMSETLDADTASKKCRTALFGSECYKRVIWVMREGIIQHPEWYPNLLLTSSFEEVQAELHRKNECHCDAPCAELMDPSVLVGPWPSSFLPDFQLETHKPSNRLLEAPNNKPLLTRIADTVAGVTPEVPMKLKPKPLNPEICSTAVPTDTDAMRIAAEVIQQDPKQTSSPLWTLPESELNSCFDALVGKNVIDSEDRKYQRNWCWVGLKEFGCHRHFYDHLSWAKMQQISLAAGATSNATFHPLKNPQVCDQQVFGGTSDWTQSAWSRARLWFAQHVNVYVLSLPTSVVRRTTIRTMLDTLRIPFKFVDGVDMRVRGGLEAAKKEGLIPMHFNVSEAQAEAYNPRNGMGTAGSIMGTLGCASGHFRAQNQGAERDPKAITIVFEDDVSPEEDFIPKFWRLVTQDMPCDWQAVSLYSRCPFGTCVSPHLTRVQPDVNEPAWRCRHGVNYGFQGIVYRTKEIPNLQRLWKPVVFDEKRPHCLDVDVALASISDSIRFYAVPASQNPGFLKEISMGSARVDINFHNQNQAIAPEKPQKPQAVAPLQTAPPLSGQAFCGSGQGADGCAKDGRAKGWCSANPRNCQKCEGKWCEKAAAPVEWVGQ